MLTPSAPAAAGVHCLPAWGAPPRPCAAASTAHPAPWPRLSRGRVRADPPAPAGRGSTRRSASSSPGSPPGPACPRIRRSCARSPGRLPVRGEWRTNAPQLGAAVDLGGAALGLAAGAPVQRQRRASRILQRLGAVALDARRADFKAHAAFYVLDDMVAVDGLRADAPDAVALRQLDKVLVDPLGFGHERHGGAAQAAAQHAAQFARPILVRNARGGFAPSLDASGNTAHQRQAVGLATRHANLGFIAFHRPERMRPYAASSVRAQRTSSKTVRQSVQL